MARARILPPDTRQAQHLERLTEFYPQRDESFSDDDTQLSSYNRDPFDVLAALEEESGEPIARS